jgi:(4S)-4-hydroxy-5-phosphonooxypentane-2,3-dione isomerase
MEPVYVFAKWQVKGEHLATVLSLLPQVAKKSREEKGNLFYKIHQSTSDANTLMLYEGYADEAAAQEHRNTEHFQEIVLTKIIPLLGNREVVVSKAILEEADIE